MLSSWIFYWDTNYSDILNRRNSNFLGKRLGLCNEHNWGVEARERSCRVDRSHPWPCVQVTTPIFIFHRNIAVLYTVYWVFLWLVQPNICISFMRIWTLKNRGDSHFTTVPSVGTVVEKRLLVFEFFLSCNMRLSRRVCLEKKSNQFGFPCWLWSDSTKLNRMLPLCSSVLFNAASMEQVKESENWFARLMQWKGFKWNVKGHGRQSYPMGG